MSIIGLIGLALSDGKKKKKNKYTNKNIEVEVKKDLFYTKYSFCSYWKDYSQLIDVYYNDVRIGIMKDTFKFDKSISKEDRDRLKPMVKEYLKHCYLVKKEKKKEKKRQTSSKLWTNMGE